jgi:DNA-binding NtrC family response regulator
MVRFGARNPPEAEPQLFVIKELSQECFQPRGVQGNKMLVILLSTYGISVRIGRAMVQVLVVEDEKGLLRNIEKSLKTNGFDVLTAIDAGAARRVFHENKVDCLCLDIHLPDINGLDLLLELRRRHPGVPAIIMSGSAKHEIKLRAEEHNVLGFLFKPFRLTELTDILVQITEIVEIRGVRGVKETKRRWTQKE